MVQNTYNTLLNMGILLYYPCATSNLLVNSVTTMQNPFNYIGVYKTNSSEVAMITLPK